MDEAAAIDGAGPVPDAVVGAPAAGLAGRHRGRDLPPRLLVERLLRAADLPLRQARDPDRSPLGLQRFNGVHYRDPGLIQAGTLMTLIIPVIAFLRLPALLHPRHRHHRRREVRRTMPCRVALTFDAEHPDRPASRPAHGRGAARRLAEAGVPRDVLRAGPLGGGVPGVGARDRRRRAPGRQPLALPCPDAAADRRPGSRDGRARRRERRSATRHRRRIRALVPLPVRGRRGRPARSWPRSPPPATAHVGWHVAADDWDPPHRDRS